MRTDPLESSQPLSTAEQPLSTSDRYGNAAITFHWSMFALVLMVGTLGLLHDDWHKKTQGYWINVHALSGLLLWGVVIARFIWRMKHTPPALPDDAGAIARWFSSPVHFALYALMFVTPIFGFITFIYHGRIFDFGLFQLDFGIPKTRAIFEPTEDIHGYLAYALFALAGLHALAALWHQFYLHDGILGRMWPRRPGTARRPEAAPPKLKGAPRT
jgi:cytochrome b561